MDEFLKMDVFFAVATIAVVVVAVLVSLAVMRVLRILRHVEKLSATVTEEAQLIKGDIDDARERVRKEGFKMAHLARFVRASVKRFVGRKLSK